MIKFIKEYRRSLKNIELEEVIDLLFYRPIAFLIVKLIYKFPITPNQISFISLITGITSGILFSFGDKKSFFYGALFFMFAHILDCCDGMVARLKKKGNLTGRIIDGWVDYTTSVITYAGLCLGLHNSSISLPLPPYFLVTFALISLGAHCMIVDYYRQEFLAHGIGKKESVWDSKKLFTDELERLNKKKGNRLEKLMIKFYLGYTKIQIKKSIESKTYPRKTYYSANKPLLFFWNWIGNSTHITILIIAALLYQPMIFFIYIIVFANLMMLILGIIQTRINKRILIKTEP